MPSSAQQLDALLKLCMHCDMERLSGRWHLIPSLSKLCLEDSKWRHCSHFSNNKTVMWKRSIWLLHRWAEGALSKMNAEVPATKLTLTCQINSESKEREREGEREGWGGRGDSLSFFDKSYLLVTKTAQRETMSCCWDHITNRHCQMFEVLVFLTVTEQSCWYIVCPYKYYTNTHRHARTGHYPVRSPLWVLY